MKYVYLACLIFPLAAQAQQIDVRGIVKTAENERLPLASIIVYPDSVILGTDADGEYAMRVRRGIKTFYVSYTGFESQTRTIDLTRDTVMHFAMRALVNQLDEVVVTEDRYSNADIFEASSSGTYIITQKDLYRMPSFMGEPDPLRTMQLLPGVVRGMEGSSDTFVRGGAADQNLVLLDGAPIYNTNHLLGFMSVFNPDIIENVEMINGGFPASFGGRLSSVLNINTVADIPEKRTISADVGMIASRLRIEQPVVKDKVSVWVAGRRSYIDYVLKNLTNRRVPYHFSDVNAKVIYHPTETDHIEVSHFSGEDFLDFFRDKNGDGQGMVTNFTSTNSSQTFKWKHFIPGGWENHLSMFRTHYKYNTRNAYKKYLVSAHSEIEDYGVKYFIKKRADASDATTDLGMEWIRHELSPNVLNSEGTISDFLKSDSLQGQIVQELAAYAQHEWTVAPFLKMNAGFRGSMAITGNRRYFVPEPRFSARFELSPSNAIKLNYSRMAQFIHRVSNSAITSPIDIWYPVTDDLRPQTAHQFTMAWERFSPDAKLFLSLEGYYKMMDDLISYEEGTNLLFKSDFVSRLIQGKGKAYGMEFLLRKDAGKFTGWISYSLSWSWRQFDALNNGRWFHARYDRRHNGAVVAQHLLGKRWAASIVFEFISGSRFTPQIGQYAAMAPNMAGIDLVPLYAGINSVKLTDSHRLDMGLKFFSKPSSKVKWNLSAGVYNVYNRATPVGIFIEENDQNNGLTYVQPGLFGLLPFVSCGLKF